jgi:hypothetical protein
MRALLQEPQDDMIDSLRTAKDAQQLEFAAFMIWHDVSRNEMKKGEEESAEGFPYCTWLFDRLSRGIVSVVPHMHMYTDDERTRIRRLQFIVLKIRARGAYDDHDYDSASPGSITTECVDGSLAAFYRRHSRQKARVECAGDAGSAAVCTRSSTMPHTAHDDIADATSLWERLMEASFLMLHAKHSDIQQQNIKPRVQQILAPFTRICGKDIFKARQTSTVLKARDGVHVTLDVGDEEEEEEEDCELELDMHNDVCGGKSCTEAANERRIAAGHTEASAYGASAFKVQTRLSTPVKSLGAASVGKPAHSLAHVAAGAGAAVASVGAAAGEWAAGVCHPSICCIRTAKEAKALLKTVQHAGTALPLVGMHKCFTTEQAVLRWIVHVARYHCQRQGGDGDSRGVGDTSAVTFARHKKTTEMLVGGKPLCPSHVHGFK